jgi:TATA-box binding protein (TBP) (component of TFIID and TFIIIB)
MVDTFKEFHVKIFNTGKLEIPGIQTDDTFNILLKLIIQLLQPYINETLEYKENSCETILINSNFNCGFHLNREVLHNILKYKYKIQTSYDPGCSYPGIQSKFYFNPNMAIQDGLQTNIENKINTNLICVSFMIFRTGSILISGKCDVKILNIIYDFLNIILTNEYTKIHQPTSTIDFEPDNELDDISVNEIEDISHLSKLHKEKLNKKKKIRKRKIIITIPENYIN